VHNLLTPGGILDKARGTTTSN